MRHRGPGGGAAFSAAQPAGGLPLEHPRGRVQQLDAGGRDAHRLAAGDAGQRAGRLRRAGRGPEVTTGLLIRNPTHESPR